MKNTNVKKTIAEHMVDVLNEIGFESVWYGDLPQIHECAKRAGMYDRKGDTHPLSINNRVLSSLDKSKYFEKRYMKHIGRPCRVFILKKEYKDKTKFKGDYNESY